MVLFAVRPLLLMALDRSGHGELLVLFGLFASLVLGAAGFELVGLKADLGALVLGVLLAQHPKASELAKALFSFKEIFLVGFFLKIGFFGAPSLQGLGIAALFVAVVPFKVALFFFLLTRFHLRARSAVLGSFSLANYSEFGLIVAAIGQSGGWLDGQWLVIIAIALSASFVLASPLNTAAHAIYARFSDRLKRFETRGVHPDDQPIDPGDAQIAILGMGRVGTGAYDFMRTKFGDVVIGVDHDPLAVARQQQEGRNVIYGDPTDLDFWARTPAKGDKVRAILLTMSKFAANLTAAKLLAERGYGGVMAASAHFDDEVAALKEAGVHAAYNFYADAGTGLAEEVYEAMELPGSGQMEEKGK